MLEKGVEVQILGTDSVLTKTPNLVGQIAIIKESPIHPATWYKVLLSDGSIHTLRPSALHPVSEGDPPAIIPKISKRRGYDDSDSVAANIGERRSQMRSRGNSIDSTYSYTHSYNYDSNSGSGVKTKSYCKPSNYVNSSNSNSNCNNSNTNGNDGSNNDIGNNNIPHPSTLNYLEVDRHIGKEVRILVGRLTGQLGVITGSSNGWVQLNTSCGTFAKRANELTFELNESLKYLQSITNHCSHSSSSRNNYDNYDNYIHLYNGSTDSTSRAIKLAKRRRLNEGSDDDDDDDAIDAVDNDSNHYNNTSFASIVGDVLPAQFPSYGAYAGGEMKGISKDAASKHSGPLIHPYFIQQKRIFVQQYVNKLSSKINGRPNLKNYSALINNNNNFIDRSYELSSARDFDDIFCRCCLIEKWSIKGSCWNENCPLSPIYYRLPGGSGEAQVTLSYIEAIQVEKRNRLMQHQKLLLLRHEEIEKEKENEIKSDSSGSSNVDSIGSIGQELVRPWHHRQHDGPPPPYIRNPVFSYLQQQQKGVCAFSDDIHGSTTTTGVESNNVTTTANSTVTLPSTPDSTGPDKEHCNLTTSDVGIVEFAPPIKRLRSSTDQTDVTDSSCGSSSSSSSSSTLDVSLHTDTTVNDVFVGENNSNNDVNSKDALLPPKIPQKSYEVVHKHNNNYHKHKHQINPTYRGRADSLGATDCEVNTP